MARRIVLADDHSVLRVGLRAFLEDQEGADLEIIDECDSGEAAVAAADSLRPDLMLLDLSMPGLGGLGATIEIRRRGLPVKILILTQHAETVSLRRSLEAGANGYVVKTARGEELVGAIRAVLAGGTYIDPQVAGALVTPPGESKTDDDALSRLTPRERQVLQLVAEGYKNREIATRLDIAVKTVMAHRSNLMDKLDLHNQSKLVQFAIRAGLMSVDD